MRTIKLGYLYGPWELMSDRDGKPLLGVYGKAGVRGLTPENSYIGADFIRIDPGCGFAPHAHAGDHILHVLEGRGIVNFDGNDIELYPGNVVLVPADYPHAVTCPKDATTPMMLLAIGYPHHEISSPWRSYPISENHGSRGKTPPVRAHREIDNRS
jgi:quercetin dioxygenase-like cupin family protein